MKVSDASGSFSCGRLASLDALRGFDMLWIMGGARIVRGWCQLWSDGKDWALYRQMCHVSWDGLAFYDTIFPLFVFIAGVSFPFSYASQVARNRTRGEILLKVLRRVALLVLLGIVYNGLLRDGFDKFRYASVLGKIGIAWGIAAVWCVFFGVKARLGIFLGTLAAYWTMLQFTAPDAPAGAGPYTLDGCFPGYLDRLGFTPGWLYCDNKLEPSGVVVSSIGSSASAILGMLAGDLVRSTRESLTPARKSAALAAFGLVLLAAGWLLSFNCPIVKNLWTPSFTLVCGGESFLLFALFHYVIDVKGLRGWTFPLVVIGANAIAAYMLQAVFSFERTANFFFGAVAKLFPTPNFMLGVGYTVCCWLVLWFLYRKKAFFKV